MESAKALADNAMEVPCVVINCSCKRALFAMRCVLMAKRRASVMFVMKNARQSRFSVLMGRKKNNARPAERKKICANMANADISAHSVVGRAFVNMDVSKTIAGTAAEIPYVFMGARFIGAPFAVKTVSMAKGAVDAIVVFGIAKK